MLNQRHRVIADDGGNIIRLIEDSSSSLWYHRFNSGMKYRMGNVWRPNKALSTELVLKVLGAANQKMKDAESNDEAHRWMVFTAYVKVSYVISLLGSEGLLLDIKALRELKKKSTKEYMWLALRGKLKG